MPVTSAEIADAVGGIVAEHGFDLEDVDVSWAGPKSRVVLTVDRDGGSGLDDLAELSRTISAAIDDDPRWGQTPFTLEVTSPGVDRPLTAPRHWRRAQGRPVTIRRTDGGALTARIGRLQADEAAVELVVRERTGPSIRLLPLADVDRAVAGVDFRPPSAAELELSGVAPVEPADSPPEVDSLGEADTADTGIDDIDAGVDATGGPGLLSADDPEQSDIRGQERKENK
ncbi:hypothetical protein GCM10027169_36820 [Gordonia jinhuaensis]|uniref:Ribosome maturation factor RimP n=1 Tax=Gordonia jinhuaensis TaxID=1517702 RepID=A0A916T0P3_9ACTN|nr:ribosome maturation factor RimP [Gordonia jinhuaensis]GGB26770.1 hypothetical protein GCM10011489_13610 [Gordonia jinhuaensis]